MENVNSRLDAERFELVLRYIGAARAHFEAVKILAASPSGHPLEAAGLLSAHALEVALKAFLLLKGRTEEYLRKEIGHDLDRGWRDAVAHGLQIDKDPPWWCLVLYTFHKAPYLYRYPKVGLASGLPLISDLEPGLERVLTAVQAAIPGALD